MEASPALQAAVFTTDAVLTAEALTYGIPPELALAFNIYGEAAPNPETNNLRGQVYRIYDGAGVQEHETFDVDPRSAPLRRDFAARATHLKS